MERSAEILIQIYKAFPGLENGEDDVNGSDLVDWFNENREEISQAIKAKK